MTSDGVLGAVVRRWKQTAALMAYTPAQSTNTNGGLWAGEIPQDLTLTPGQVFALVAHEGETPDWTFENVYTEETRLNIVLWALGDGTAGNDSLALAERVTDLVKQTFDWCELDYIARGVRVQMERTGRKIDPVGLHAPSGEIVFQDMTEWRVVARRERIE